MKKNNLIFALCFVQMIFCVPPLHAEIIDKIVAVVNDEPITQGELDINFMPIYQQYRQTYQGAELEQKLTEARRMVLNQLIEDALVAQDAQKKGLKITDEELESRMKEFRDRFASEDEFRKKLGEQGLTMSELRERIKNQVAVQKMRQYEVYGKINISPLDVEEYYTAHKDDYSKPERAKVSTILLRKEPSKEEISATRVKMEDIVSQISQGMPFADLARKFSQDAHADEGGALGFIKRGQMIPSIDEAIFTTEVGAITPIIETDIGFHIFLVEAKQEASARALEEVRPEIEERLFRERADARYKAWIEELKKNAYISIK